MIPKKPPASLASDWRFFRQFRWWRARCWLCEKFCGDKFFNHDASCEIDRLLLENEKLRDGGVR